MFSNSPAEFLVIALSDWDILAEKLLSYAGRRRKFFSMEKWAPERPPSSRLCPAARRRRRGGEPFLSLVNEYRYTDTAGRHCLLHHLDLFRLKDEQEALDIGVEDYDEEYCYRDRPEMMESAGAAGRCSNSGCQPRREFREKSTIFVS